MLPPTTLQFKCVTIQMSKCHQHSTVGSQQFHSQDSNPLMQSHWQRKMSVCKDSNSRTVPSSKWEVTCTMVPTGITKLQSINVKSGKSSIPSVFGFVGHLSAFTMIYLHHCVQQAAMDNMEKRICGCEHQVQMWVEGNVRGWLLCNHLQKHQVELCESRQKEGGRNPINHER